MYAPAFSSKSYSPTTSSPPWAALRRRFPSPIRPVTPREEPKGGAAASDSGGPEPQRWCVQEWNRRPEGGGKGVERDTAAPAGQES